MLTYLDEFFSDPKGMLILFLLAFPGRVLALSLHEFAHAWVANRCGDPTAKALGRLTVNPLKHLDPLGTILMLVVGFGWAKPVPVNPNNYRNYRSDDLKVSAAGVTMNLILFVLSIVALFAWAAFALSKVPTAMLYLTNKPLFRASYQGEMSLFWQEGESTYYASLRELLGMLPYAGDTLIRPVFGAVWGYVYQMVGYFCVTNLVLCLFNLLPIPPLDGYHVLNDLVLRRDLFADAKTTRITQGVLVVLLMSGAVSKLLSWVMDGILSGAGAIGAALLQAMGLM